jgi:hypothetical protein
MKDSEFLFWLRGRLINVYGEDPHIDYVQKLYSIARKVEDDENYWNRVIDSSRQTD